MKKKFAKLLLITFITAVTILNVKGFPNSIGIIDTITLKKNTINSDNPSINHLVKVTPVAVVLVVVMDVVVATHTIGNFVGGISTNYGLSSTSENYKMEKLD